MKIADFLSVSERNLRNKRAELEISLKHSQITEMQLDAEVQTILTQNPNMGEKMLKGALLSHGITKGKGKGNVTQINRTCRSCWKSSSAFENFAKKSM